MHPKQNPSSSSPSSSSLMCTRFRPCIELTSYTCSNVRQRLQPHRSPPSGQSWVGNPVVGVSIRCRKPFKTSALASAAEESSLPTGAAHLHIKRIHSLHAHLIRRNAPDGRRRHNTAAPVAGRLGMRRHCSE